MRIPLFLILVTILHFSNYAQKSEKNTVKPEGFQDFRFDSKLMKRRMPYRVILPDNYSQKRGEKFPVIYLIHGLTGHFSDWTENTKIAEHAKNYNYIIVMPEGGNGWYTDSATISEDRYESYIIFDLIPEVEKRFRALSNRENRAIAGPSMGGYGSLKFGLKYPQMFALAGSFSGALGAAIWDTDDFGKTGILSNTVTSVFGKANSPTRKSNEIFKMVKTILPGNTKILPFFYLDCGTEDFLITINRQFSDLLYLKKIPHEFRMFPGKHDWSLWDEEIVEFLDVSKKHIKDSEPEKK